MALIIETGAIVAGAESYIDAAGYVTYWTNRNAIPAETTAAIEAALRKATAYIDGKYRLRWKGDRVDAINQPLEFPRIGVVLSNGGVFNGLNGEIVNGSIYLQTTTIPAELKAAVCEAANRALSGELAEDMSSNIKREKVDVLETEYFSGSPQGVKYQVIDQLVSRFVKSSSDVIRG